MKRVTMVASLILFASFATAYSTGKAQNSTSQHEDKSKQKQPVVTFYHDDCTCQHKESANNQVPHWYKSPEWWLVFAAIFTLGAIIYQASEMAKATKVMERSTTASENMADLQHAGMQQWIDIDAWKTMPVRGQGINDILIRFEIRNPTTFPITIRDSVITFGIFDERIRYLIGKDFRLSPKIPKEIVITMWLKDEELKRFLTDIGIRIAVHADFIHTDMGPNKKTHFVLKGNIACNVRTTTFEPELITSEKAT